MPTAFPKEPIMVQLYDYYKEAEYYKKHRGLIFSHSELVRRNTIEHHIELQINTKTMPDKVFINNEEYKLVKVKN